MIAEIRLATLLARAKRVGLATEPNNDHAACLPLGPRKRAALLRPDGRTRVDALGPNPKTEKV